MLNAKQITDKYGSTESQYELLGNHKDSLDGTWEECAELTLPYIFPRDNLDETETLPTPFNSLGPSAVNALSSKLLLALIPPTGPFFRLMPDKDKLVDPDGNPLPDEQLTQLDKELSDLEQDVVEQITLQGLRVPLFEAMKLLIVTGNAMLYKTKKKGLKVFSPHQYAIGS
jgi:hypothetical protein